MSAVLERGQFLKDFLRCCVAFDIFYYVRDESVTNTGGSLPAVQKITGLTPILQTQTFFFLLALKDTDLFIISFSLCSLYNEKCNDYLMDTNLINVIAKVVLIQNWTVTSFIDICRLYYWRKRLHGWLDLWLFVSSTIWSL